MIETASRSLVNKYSVVISVVLILSCFAAVNKFWSYGQLGQPVHLTSQHLMQSQSRGQAFSFKGVVRYFFRTKNDLLILSLKSKDGDISIQVPIWPSSGGLPRLRRGDTVEIVGNLGKYRGKWQLNPLSSEHIHIIDDIDDSLAVPLSEALKRVNEMLLIGPVETVTAAPFTSKKSGRQHLRIVVRDQDREVEGIIFDGSWDEHDLKKFETSQTVYLRAKMGSYRGKPSLQTMAVKVR